MLHIDLSVQHAPPCVHTGKWAQLQLAHSYLIKLNLKLIICMNDMKLFHVNLVLKDMSLSLLYVSIKEFVSSLELFFKMQKNVYLDISELYSFLYHM